MGIEACLPDVLREQLRRCGAEDKRKVYNLDPEIVPPDSIKASALDPALLMESTGFS